MSGDVEALLAEMLGILSHISAESGVCCCGDDMEKHASPMFSNHSPVDSGLYAIDQWKERAAIALRSTTSVRRAALEALRVIAEGDEPRPVGKVWNTDRTPSKHDKCVHDCWMYEDCGQCVSEFAAAAIRALQDAEAK